MRDILVKSLRSAFNKELKDACRNFTLKRTTTTVDEKTDANVTTVESFSGYGPFLRAKKEDIDNDLIAINDLKIIVLQDDFQTAPRIGDMINDRFRISSVGHDPTKAIWKIFVRGSEWDGIESP